MATLNSGTYNRVLENIAGHDLANRTATAGTTTSFNDPPMVIWAEPGYIIDKTMFKIEDATEDGSVVNKWNTTSGTTTEQSGINFVRFYDWSEASGLPDANYFAAMDNDANFAALSKVIAYINIDPVNIPIDRVSPYMYAIDLNYRDGKTAISSLIQQRYFTFEAIVPYEPNMTTTVGSLPSGITQVQKSPSTVSQPVSSPTTQRIVYRIEQSALTFDTNGQLNPVNLPTITVAAANNYFINSNTFSGANIATSYLQVQPAITNSGSMTDSAGNALIQSIVFTPTFYPDTTPSELEPQDYNEAYNQRPEYFVEATTRLYSEVEVDTTKEVSVLDVKNIDGKSKGGSQNVIVLGKNNAEFELAIKQGAGNNYYSHTNQNFASATPDTTQFTLDDKGRAVIPIFMPNAKEPTTYKFWVNPKSGSSLATGVPSDENSSSSVSKQPDINISLTFTQTGSNWGNFTFEGGSSTGYSQYITGDSDNEVRLFSPVKMTAQYSGSGNPSMNNAFFTESSTNHLKGAANNNTYFSFSNGSKVMDGDRAVFYIDYVRVYQAGTADVSITVDLSDTNLIQNQ